MVGCEYSDKQDKYTHTTNLSRLEMTFIPDKDQNQFIMERLFTFDTPILNLSFYAEPGALQTVHKTNMEV